MFFANNKLIFGVISVYWEYVNVLFNFINISFPCAYLGVCASGGFHKTGCRECPEIPFPGIRHSTEIQSRTSE